MVSALDRKMLRDLLRMKGQMVAILLVVACGVASFVSSISTYKSLGYSQSTYYERYRFADVFASLERAPASIEARLREIAGVSEVETRVVKDVTLDIPAMAEPAVARLISLPTSGAQLNQLYLRSGREVDPVAAEEVVVNEGFAQGQGISPGDSLRAVINGRSQSLRVVGVALSPEYVYAIKPGDLMPDDKRFGILWMNKHALAAAFDMEGAFNDVTIRLSPGASEQEVIGQIDALLGRYGGLGAIERYHQLSNRYVSDEIQSLESTGVTVPIIFLAVAAFLLNVVLSRLVSTQREQIAALKALGYGNATIGMHYLKLVTMVVLLGVALGTVVGAYFGRAMTQLYTQYFRFPALDYRLDAAVVMAALLISMAAALVGVVGSVRRAVALPPAEAMRPASPAKYSRTFLERIGILRLLSSSGRMILRSISRRPMRTFLSALGIGLAVAILLVGSFFMDSMEHIIDVQFNFANREDVVVVFNRALPDRAVRELEHVQGVIRAEPFRAVPATLRSGHIKRRTAIEGLPPEGELRRLLTADMRVEPVPAQGLLLSNKLAQVLGVSPGDTLTVDVLEGPRLVRRVPVAAVIDESVGMAAYASIETANALLREGALVSGARLAIDPRHRDEVNRTLKRMPSVAGVTMHDAMVESFESTSKEYLAVFSSILVLFAVIIVAGVVYNSGRIALAERERELASLRVIGLTRGEISLILLGELAVQVVLSIPLGFALGYWMSSGISKAFDSELYRVPLIIEQSTYAFAALVVLIAAALTALVVRRKLDHLDLVSVLKTRE